MLSFRDGEKCFNYRVVGVALHGKHVLLHKEDREDFWSLPGGRGEWFEHSIDTLKREMIEEIGVEVEVGPLLWVVENFYTYDSQKRHELALYYRMILPEECRYINAAGPFAGVEEGVPLTFRWFHLDEIEGLTLYPSFLPEMLRSPFDGTRHIVHRDTEERRIQY